MNDKYVNITRDIILNLVDKENITVFLFGSRTEKDFRHDSDIDVGFISKGKLDTRLFNKIYEALENSIVPYHVDLVDFNKTNRNFRKIALEKIQIWNKAKDSDIN